MTHNPTSAELQDFIDDILTIKPVKIDGLNGVIAPHKMQLLLLILQQWKEQHNRVELLERFYNSRPLVDDIEASASHWRHIAVETQSILAAERERSEKFASAVAYYLYGHVRNEGWKSAATIELEEALERYRHRGEMSEKKELPPRLYCTTSEDYIGRPWCDAQFTEQDHSYTQYLSLSEHNALLAEAVREARATTIEEISGWLGAQAHLSYESYDRLRINLIHKAEAARTEGGKGGQ